MGKKKKKHNFRRKQKKKKVVNIQNGETTEQFHITTKRGAQIKKNYKRAEKDGYIFLKVKFRIYPTKEQKEQINSILRGCERIWNRYIDYRNYLTKKHIESPTVSGFMQKIHEWDKNPDTDPINNNWDFLHEVKGILTPARQALEILYDRYEKATIYYNKYHTLLDMPDPPRYRTKYYPMRTFTLRSSFNMLKEDDESLYISMPVLKYMRIANPKDTLPDSSDITSGMVSIERGLYYLTLTYKKYGVDKKYARGVIPIKVLQPINEPTYQPSSEPIIVEKETGGD